MSEEEGEIELDLKLSGNGTVAEYDEGAELMGAITLSAELPEEVYPQIVHQRDGSVVFEVPPPDDEYWSRFADGDEEGEIRHQAAQWMQQRLGEDSISYITKFLVATREVEEEDNVETMVEFLEALLRGMGSEVSIEVELE